MTRPYELLARFRPDGTVGGVSVRTITTVNGRDFESDPQPLADATDPAFVAFAQQFGAKTLAERDAAVAERDTARAALATVTAERDALRLELDAIKNPVDNSGFPVLSAVQLRLGIIASGLSIEKVESAIDNITDETQRIRVRTYWEFATQFERQHPLVKGMIGLLELTDIQADELWRMAGGIQ